MPDLSFGAYRRLHSAGQREVFRAAMEARGYYAFFAFTEDFRESLKTYSDSEMEEIGSLIGRVRSDFPKPGRFSPSWEMLWEEFQAIYDAKNETLAEISASDRSGEWQVLIDNPYMPQQVACYPGLAFLDAAYLFAYFQKDLKPNEFLRLQKVTHVHVKTGLKEATLFPDL
ncbi:hypothetical protein GE107_18910 [Cohnella sp. CFH 77786]|uniref:hypothetical protein n=1 Tax=Cohnella sp. CFH 77786 TaxID=2662265 RepID=UPI001C60E386|nr:hypothetical protein [Cohnella sp. CFH 77786]MBW5448132.1 hypothetical protein [Cohnella sp. CFH 77786]